MSNGLRPDEVRRSARAKSVKKLDDACEGFGRADVARLCPRDELGDIHPAVRGFAVVNPTLRTLQPRAEVALGELSLLSQFAQQRRQLAVSG